MIRKLLINYLATLADESTKADRHRIRSGTYHDHGALERECADDGHHIVRRGDGVDDHVEGAADGGQVPLVARGHEDVGAHRHCRVAFGFAARNHSHMSSKCLHVYIDT